MPFCRAHTTAVDDRTPRAARESLSHVLGVRSDAVHGGSRRLRSRCIGYFIPIVLNTSLSITRFRISATRVPRFGASWFGFAPGTAAGVRSIKLLNRVSEH